MDYFESAFFDENLESHLPDEKAIPKNWRGKSEILSRVLIGLGRIHAEDDEVIAVLGVSSDEWREMVKDNPALQVMLDHGKAQGKVAIRHRQVQRAMQGSDAMLKHVGRHILGQHEKVEVSQGLSLAERKRLLDEVERRHEERLIDVTPESHESTQERQEAVPAGVGAESD